MQLWSMQVTPFRHPPGPAHFAQGIPRTVEIYRTGFCAATRHYEGQSGKIPWVVLGLHDRKRRLASVPVSVPAIFALVVALTLAVVSISHSHERRIRLWSI